MFSFEKHKKTIFIVLILTILIFIINIIVSNIIKKKIIEAILSKNSESHIVSVEKARFHLLERAVTIEDISYIPTDLLLSELKQGKSGKNSLQKFTISSIKLNGINVIKLIFNKNININSLNINGLVIVQISNPKIKEKGLSQSKPLNLDSIYIKNINGFKIEKINFTNIEYKVLDITTNKVSFQTSPISFQSNGFILEYIKPHLFKLNLMGHEFYLDKISVDFKDSKYRLSIDKITANFDEKQLNISKVSLKPTIDRVALGKSYKYTSEVYNIEIEDLKIYNYDLSKTLKNKGVFIDSIELDGLNLKIYKDKRKPFNTKKRPVLINYKLKKMELPLMIQKITIRNSNLKYEEREEKRKELMTVSLNDIKARINNVTSIKTHRKTPMTISLESKLMNKAKMKVDLNFPLADDQNTFYFNGSLAASKFQYYDSAIYPALGIKISKGVLDGLTFEASADNYSSNGKMTMLYHDLATKLFKSESNDKSKFKSWGANRIVHKANPGKKNKVREVVMSFDRVEYKGLGNYLWKTIQSGLLNTIAPLGKKTKESKDQQKREKKELKREKKEEKNRI